MKKIVKLTESDLIRIVGRVIKEQENEPRFDGTMETERDAFRVKYLINNIIEKYGDNADEFMDDAMEIADLMEERESLGFIINNIVAKYGDDGDEFMDDALEIAELMEELNSLGFMYDVDSMDVFPNDDEEY